MMAEKKKWSFVHHSSASVNEDCGDYNISVYKFPVEGGYLYRVTEMKDGACHINTTFVPSMNEDEKDKLVQITCDEDGLYAINNRGEVWMYLWEGIETKWTRVGGQ
jgi:hypothetical protein